VVAGGSVYVTGFDGNLSVFDAAGCGASACKLRWQGHTGNDITSSTAVAGGVAYVGDSGGRLYAFTVGGCGAARCKPLWVGQAGAGQSLATPAVGGGRVFVGSFQAIPEEFTGNLFAFPAAGCGKATCKPLRAYDVGSTTTPALVGDTLLSSTQATPDPNTSGVVAAFPADGCGAAVCEPLWTGVNFADGFESSPVVAGKVMLNSTDNTGAPDVPAQTNLYVLALP